MSAKRNSKILTFLRIQLDLIFAAFALACFIISILLFILGETKGDRTWSVALMMLSALFVIGAVAYQKWRP